MKSNNLIFDHFENLRVFSCAEKWALSSNKVRERPSRMEAIFYGSDGYQAVESMHHAGFTQNVLGDLALVTWPGIFARRFVKDKKHGVPFLTTSKMMEARPVPNYFLSKLNTKNIDSYLVKKGTILISRSGTIGNIVLVNENIDSWVVTEDAIRVIVKNEKDLGPVYCYLQSSLGQFLLQRSQTGSVVRHIYEADVSNLPIPKFPLRLREELTKRIKEVSKLRVEANRLLDQAERMLYQQLSFSEEDFSLNKEFQINIVKSCELFTTIQYKGNLRLDVYPFNELAKKVRKIIKKYNHKILKDLVKEVIYIGKVYRIPVEDTKKLCKNSIT